MCKYTKELKRNSACNFSHPEMKATKPVATNPPPSQWLIWPPVQEKSDFYEIYRLAYHATNCSMCDLATLSGLRHFLSYFPLGSGSLLLV